MTLADAVTGEAVKQATDLLVEKDLKWWLIAGALIIGTVTLTALKWLFNSHSSHFQGLQQQLSEQRVANEKLHERHLNYIATDHLSSVRTMEQVTIALKELSAAISNMPKDRHG